MDKFFVPIKAFFDNQTVNVLNVDSGLEFFAEDIFNLVSYNQSHFDIPENLRRIRVVLIDGTLHRKQTLCWLALKYVFRQFSYSQQSDFVRWIRKTLSPALALENLDEGDIKTLDGINLLSWFFVESDKCIDSLVSIYQSSLFSFFGIPPSIILSPNSFINPSKNADKSNDLTPSGQTRIAQIGYEIYLKLLKRQLSIPDYQILHTSDLAARLLRQRYLESASIVLGINNIDYYNLYDTFVLSCQDLLLAQELDIAIIFALKKKTIPYLMLQVIEGGFFLQALLACTLAGTVEKSLSLQIKQVYTNWLNHLLVNIAF